MRKYVPFNEMGPEGSKSAAKKMEAQIRGGKAPEGAAPIPVTAQGGEPVNTAANQARQEKAGQDRTTALAGFAAGAVKELTRQGLEEQVVTAASDAADQQARQNLSDAELQALLANEALRLQRELTEAERTRLIQQAQAQVVAQEQARMLEERQAAVAKQKAQNERKAARKAAKEAAKKEAKKAVTGVLGLPGVTPLDVVGAIAVPPGLNSPVAILKIGKALIKKSGFI